MTLPYKVVQTVVNPENLTDRVNILIKNKELAKALENFFDSVWKKARKIEEIKSN